MADLVEIRKRANKRPMRELTDDELWTILELSSHVGPLLVEKHADALQALAELAEREYSQRELDKDLKEAR